MRRFIAVVLVSLLVLSSAPLTSAAGRSTGIISGVARTTAGQPLAGHTVRVRSVSTGVVVGTTTTSISGSFTVASLAPGSYVVEIADFAGRIVGTSMIASVGEGQISSVGVTAASAARVGGAVSGGVLAILIAGGAAAAIGIAVAATDDEDASPSQ